MEGVKRLRLTITVRKNRRLRGLKGNAPLKERGEDDPSRVRVGNVSARTRKNQQKSRERREESYGVESRFTPRFKKRPRDRSEKCDTAGRGSDKKK